MTNFYMKCNTGAEIRKLGAFFLCDIPVARGDTYSTLGVVSKLCL